ncbi:MAG TPA: nucleoside recognition domain-containing protein, partial [Candidatus Polarisedimenticolaceae bacterium]|nr:nucleoside recognition domain-containing protein [Candidatus Polarisedimenticolaceae bacterium]
AAPSPRIARWVGPLAALAFFGLLARQLWRAPTWNSASPWLLPGLVGGVLVFAWSQGVKVYEALVEGAKEGFQVALRVLPYLVAMLVAVGMLRASGAIERLGRGLDPLTSLIHVPAEIVPLVLLRPLSGSGALGLMTDLTRAHGPDSLLGYMAGAVQGSTETTFYVLAVYFGAVGIKRARHALPACLLADATGMLVAVLLAAALFG